MAELSEKKDRSLLALQAVRVVEKPLFHMLFLINYMDIRF